MKPARMLKNLLCFVIIFVFILSNNYSVSDRENTDALRQLSVKVDQTSFEDNFKNIIKSRKRLTTAQTNKAVSNCEAEIDEKIKNICHEVIFNECKIYIHKNIVKQIRVINNDDNVILQNLSNERDLKLFMDESLEGGLIGEHIESEKVKAVKIGSYWYRADKGPIFLHEEWFGNNNLIEWIGKSAEELADYDFSVKTGVSKTKYTYNIIKDSLSWIKGRALLFELPSQSELDEAKTYLARGYNINYSNKQKQLFYHYLSVLIRHNASSGDSYKKIAEDRLLATDLFLKAASNTMETLDKENRFVEERKILEDIMWSMGVLMIKANGETDTSSAILLKEVKERLTFKKPFIVDSPQTFENLAKITEEVVKNGLISLYIIISIKNFSKDAYIAYIKELQVIAEEYKNIVFILSIERSGVLTHDMPGGQTALRRTGDLLGKDFFVNEHVAMITDGGSKTRGGPPTNAHHGQFSLAASVRVGFVESNYGNAEYQVILSTFLKSNIDIILTTWLQMRNAYGENVFLWLSSDGIIQFGTHPGFSNKLLSDLPERFMAASGDKVDLFTPEISKQMTEFAAQEKIPIGVLLLNNNPAPDDIELYADKTGRDIEDVKTFLLLPQLKEIREDLFKNFGEQIEKAKFIFDSPILKLKDKGNFVTDEKGYLRPFMEKPNFSALAESVLEKGQGRNIMNIFFIMTDKETLWDLIIEKFSQVCDLQTGQSIGQRKVSIFDKIFGGYGKKDMKDPISCETIKYATDQGVAFIGCHYGDNAYVGDIGNLDLNAKMFDSVVENERLKFDARRNGSSVIIPFNVTILYEGKVLSSKDNPLFILKNVRISAPSEGSYIINLSRGTAIINSSIVFNENFTQIELTKGSKIIDCNLFNPVKIIGEGAILESCHHMPNNSVLGSTYDNAIGLNEEVKKEFVPVETLVAYGGETTVTNFIQMPKGQFLNVVVRAWHFDYKAPINKVCEEYFIKAESAEEAFKLMQKEHPMILGIKGISSWEDIFPKDQVDKADSFSLYELPMFGCYTFEQAKERLRALPMRNAVIFARNAYKGSISKEVAEELGLPKSSSTGNVCKKFQEPNETIIQKFAQAV